ncbi:MAG TPA: DUF423 domain-containing protein [Leucothrix mucor]|uniref:DUF423 domain-containing protein n=1 Tax=Leucothrix mucor TaxID=45248 RepID=A0A7V2SYX6_LEUMU|nr:DUF423 domain-containing protein [Leucothrix mucor]
MNKFLALGSVFALLAVIIGAFGAHGLEKSIIDEKMLARFNTGVEYQFYHAFGILVVAILLQNKKSRLLNSAGVAFIFGIILFSGSLYGYVLTGSKTLAMITPVGGLAFIIGWILLVIYSFNDKE